MYGVQIHISRNRFLRFSPGGIVLHLAFLFIIGGGITTWLTAREETLILYPNRPETHAGVTFELREFEIVPNTDYISTLTVNDCEVVISVNHPATVNGARLCQLSFIADGGSVIGLRRDLPGTVVAFIGFALFVVGGLMVIVDRWRRGERQHWADCGIAAALAICGIYMSLGGRGDSLPPVLRTWWLPVHVGLVITAYASLAVVALLAVVNRTERARRMLLPAVWLLGLGIIAGSIWAEQSWGRYWGWDPKETCALITLLLYAVPLHLRCPNRLWYIIPLAAVAMTWFGVNMLPSLHSYAT